MPTKYRLELGFKEKTVLMTIFCVLPFAIYLPESVTKMRTAQKDSPDLTNMNDVYSSIYWALLICIIRYGASKLLIPLGRKILSKSKRIQEDRVERFATVTFKFLFFLVFTVLGYYTLRDEVWFPTALGGKATPTIAFHALSYCPVSDSIKLYFLVELGYHLHSLIYVMAFSPYRNDFTEMFLHHCFTIILMVTCYCVNLIAMGSLLVFTHDIGDVVGYGIKAVVDTDYKKLVILMYFTLLTTWAYTRLYVYPVYALQGSYFYYLQHYSVDNFFYYSTTTMLSILLVLHIYWFILFLRMGYILVKSGKAEDIQQKCIDVSQRKKIQ